MPKPKKPIDWAKQEAAGIVEQAAHDPAYTNEQHNDLLFEAWLLWLAAGNPGMTFETWLTRNNEE